MRERQLLWFSQVKGGLLFLDGAWLAAIVVALGGVTSSTITGPSGLLLAGLEVLLLGGGLLSLAGLGITFVREVVGSETGGRVFGPRLFWGHLTGVQFSLLCGLEFGGGLALSDLDRAGGALLVLGLGGAVLQAGGTFLGMVLRSVPERPWETTMETVVKVIVYVGVGISGLDLMAPEPQWTPLVALLEACRPVAPVASVLCGLVGVQWLIESKSQPDARTSRPGWSDWLSQRLLVATALLPVGGLAIPWWIRRRWQEVGQGSKITHLPWPVRPARKPF